MNDVRSAGLCTSPWKIVIRVEFAEQHRPDGSSSSFEVTSDYRPKIAITPSIAWTVDRDRTSPFRLFDMPLLIIMIGRSGGDGLNSRGRCGYLTFI